MDGPRGTGGGITGYKIERSTNSGGAWTVLVASQTARTYTTGNLNTGVTPYWFRVTAISATGPGPAPSLPSCPSGFPAPR